jgi:hypothetical protein
VAEAAFDLARAGRRQRWQVMATYSLQPAWLQLPPAAFGIDPVISSIDASVGHGLGKIPRLAIGAAA